MRHHESTWRRDFDAKRSGGIKMPREIADKKLLTALEYVRLWQMSSPRLYINVITDDCLFSELFRPPAYQINALVINGDVRAIDGCRLSRWNHAIHDRFTRLTFSISLISVHRAYLSHVFWRNFGPDKVSSHPIMHLLVFSIVCSTALLKLY